MNPWISLEPPTIVAENLPDAVDAGETGGVRQEDIDRLDDAIVDHEPMLPVGPVGILSEDLAGLGNADHIGVARSGRIESLGAACVVDETVEVALIVAVISDGLAGGVDTGIRNIDIDAPPAGH